MTPQGEARPGPDTAGFDPTRDDLQRMPSAALYALLDDGQRDATMRYIDWLMRETPLRPSGDALVTDICERLRDIGVPLDRYLSTSTVNTAETDALGRTWVHGQGTKENIYVRTRDDAPEFLHSPFHESAETGRWVDLWLPTTPDDRFGIVPDLKADGYTHYLCLQLPASVGVMRWLTVATKAETGFTLAHRVIVALIAPALSALIDTRVTRLTLDRLLRTYVGDEPHRAILEGNVKRGQVTTIRSVILFADMRDSTGQTAEISAVEAVGLFNEFFDCLVPPIERRRGEVLKYIGDGLLAIFRYGDADGSPRETTRRALDAARQALANVAAFNANRPDKRPVGLGIALHFGEAAYGNVGSGLRLDFTVIGRDIGLASRIGGLNAQLEEPLLLSAAFVRKLGLDAEPIGAFTVRGFTQPVAVFRPIAEDP